MKKHKPAFSVLMANFNKSDFVQTAIESVIDQEFTDWELIIIDDGSTDNSVDKISSAIFNFPSIKLFQNYKRKGVAYCQNRLVGLSTADFFGVLDSDDALSPNALSEVWEVFKANPDIGFVYSKLMICDRELNPVKTGSNTMIPDGESVLRYDRVGAFRCFRRKDFLQTTGYDQDYMFADDADIVIKMEEITSFYFIDKILYYYRILFDSQFNTPEKRVINYINHARSKLAAYSRRKGTAIPNLSPREISNEIYKAAFYCNYVPSYSKWKFLKQAFFLSPFNLAGLVRYCYLEIKNAVFNIDYTKI